MYAAKEALGFEPQTLPEETHDDAAYDQLWEMIEKQVRFGMLEVLCKQANAGSSGCPAWQIPAMCAPVVVSINCPVMRTRLPALRTLPSST